jgi:hypothetical protein
MFGGIGGRAVGADIVYCWIVKERMMGTRMGLGRQLHVFGRDYLYIFGSLLQRGRYTIPEMGA